MIAGIYYGTCYGGSTTAILVNIPGEAQSVVTCIDGYQMARNGRAGVAIGMAAIASFIAGTLGAVAIGLVSVPLINFAIRFGPPEFFILMALGVYLGLVVRFNSWDMFSRTEEVLRTAFSVTDRPRLTLAIVLFGFFLWAVYEVIDIWMDGFALRWGRRKQAQEGAEERSATLTRC